jgi:arsenite methyltransferase
MNRDLAEIDHRSRTYSLTNGRIMADFVLGRQRITRDEVEVWTQDLERLGQEGDYFFSLNRYLFLADRS